MSAEKAILDKLRWDHVGMNRPILLDGLLNYLCESGVIDLDEKNRSYWERTVRRIIAENQEICNIGHGYFLARKIGHKEDVEETIQYLRRTYEEPLRIKIANKKLEFPQYYPKFDPNQKELF